MNSAVQKEAEPEGSITNCDKNLNICLTLFITKLAPGLICDQAAVNIRVNLAQEWVYFYDAWLF